MAYFGARRIKIFIKIFTYFYLIQALISFAVVVLYLPISIRRHGYPLVYLDTVTALLASLFCVASFILFRQLGRAYDSWDSFDGESLIENLKKLSASLYAIAVLDLMYISLKQIFLALDGQDLKYNESFKSLFDQFPQILPFADYILPRPSGLLAIMAAFFISVWIRRQKMSSK